MNVDRQKKRGEKREKGKKRGGRGRKKEKGKKVKEKIVLYLSV